MPFDVSVPGVQSGFVEDSGQARRTGGGPVLVHCTVHGVWVETAGSGQTFVFGWAVNDTLVGNPQTFALGAGGSSMLSRSAILSVSEGDRISLRANTTLSNGTARYLDGQMAGHGVLVNP